MKLKINIYPKSFNFGNAPRQETVNWGIWSAFSWILQYYTNKWAKACREKNSGSQERNLENNGDIEQTGGSPYCISCETTISETRAGALFWWKCPITFPAYRMVFAFSGAYSPPVTFFRLFFSLKCVPMHSFFVQWWNEDENFVDFAETAWNTTHDSLTGSTRGTHFADCFSFANVCPTYYLSVHLRGPQR